MSGDDRFVLKKEVGKGGQGAVWLADDTLFHREVAIKLLHADATSDSSFLRQLLKDEARLQASLSPENNPHRNIVYIIDVRPFGDEIGIVMEYVDGGSVATALGPRANRKTFPVPEFLKVVLQVCEGLSAAHSKSVVHRDIKPGNVLLRRADSVIKITDWGIAKNIDIAGRGRTFLGTRPYMSPEVIELEERTQAEKMRGAGVDQRTDIYSLGVMMYEMLLGELPFDGTLEIRRGVSEIQANALVSRKVDESLARILLKSLARRPDDRYQTVVELQRALHVWQGSLISGDLEKAWDLFKKSLDPRAAERKFQEIISRNSSDPRAFIEFARFYIQCSREEDAIALLGKGIEVAPDFAALWNARGRLHAKRSSRQAIPDLEKALSLRLPDKEARQAQAMIERLKRNEASSQPNKDKLWR